MRSRLYLELPVCRAAPNIVLKMTSNLYQSRTPYIITFRSVAHVWKIDRDQPQIKNFQSLLLMRAKTDVLKKVYETHLLMITLNVQKTTISQISLAVTTYYSTAGKHVLLRCDRSALVSMSGASFFQSMLLTSRHGIIKAIVTLLLIKLARVWVILAP